MKISVTVPVYQGRLEAFCEERNILFVDTFKEFMDEGQEKIYVQRDSHFSVYGHKKYAQILWEAIKNKYPSL